MQRLSKSVPRVLAPLRSASRAQQTLPIASQIPRTTPLLRSQTRSVATAVPGKPGMSAPLMELLKARRSYYELSKDLPISQERIEELIKESLAYVPSSFNSQSNRVMVLFGADHEKLWDMTAECLRPLVPADKWEPTGKKMALFKGAAGTILFFEEEKTVKDLQAQYALYAHNFPIWALQGDGMLQFTIWLALDAEGLGANLQHYNPVVDERVAETWKVPENWKLNAQIVFGGRVSTPKDKSYLPMEELYKSFGSA